MKKILIYTTGGTIEKSYSEFDGSLRNRESLLKASLLRRLRLPYVEIEVSEVLSKDSIHMTKADREYIWNHVEKGMEMDYPIVVLHGTDTMEETARIFYEKCSCPKVPIVFTGAMKPLGFEDSDATQNVTEALMACQLLDPGHYVSFHGQLFNVPNVEKNKDRGTFQTKY